METRIVRYREKTRILGAILLLCSLVFFFFAFMGTSFVTIGWGSSDYGRLISLADDSNAWAAVESGPVELFVKAFSFYGDLDAAGVIGMVLFDLLFLGSLALVILTGVFALVNKKFFTPIPAVCVAGAHALLFIIQAIYNATQQDMMSVMPTLWLFLSIGLVIAATFLIRKEVEIIRPEPPQETVPVTEYRERTIPASRSNRQGVGINVRYTDNSGTHIIKREIYTDSPLTIGRASSNKVVLSDGRASDTHAQILYDSLNGMVVEDLGSTNGVQVNGETIMRKSRITKDDTVRIGDSKLSFEVTGTLDETGGEKTIAAGSRYHAPLRMVLTFTDDGGPRKENVVLKESAMIGKDRDCDVSVVSPTVSRKHAQLVNLGGGKAGIKDYNSTNYTYVNGVMASETVELKEGDVIKLGNVEMRVSYR